MLYLVGLGLYDEKDMSLKGLESLKKADVIYAEFYTSRLFGGNLEFLEKILGKEIIVLSREEVEEENIPLNESETKDVAFLCAGDPLIATTHMDLMIQAKKIGIDTMVIHSSSILSAAPGIAGLQAYKFGKVTTIPFTQENYFPNSPYHTIKANLTNQMHTLVLLDIQAHINRYMTVNQGLEYLLRVEDIIKENIVTDDTLAVAIARAGAEKPMVRADKVKKLLNEDFGGPLHCLIIPSQLHFLEAEALVVLGGAPNDILESSR
ncbi:MAG: diphthine synthase [Methanobacterium sp.]|nr:diphthine synthase [Methanobacterium sp.]